MPSIIDITIHWTRYFARNFPSILVIVSPVIGLFTLMDLIQTHLLFSSYNGSGGSLFMLVSTVILGPLLSAWATSSICLLVAGDWPHGRPRFAFGRPDQSAVGATVLYFFALVAVGGLLTLAGSIGARILGPFFIPLLAIPALYFATRFFLFYPHAVLTGNYAFASVAQLTYGWFWKAVGVLVMGLLVITVVETGLATIVQIALGEKSTGVGLFWVAPLSVTASEASSIAILISAIANAFLHVAVVAASAVFVTVSYLAFTGETESAADGKLATQQP